MHGPDYGWEATHSSSGARLPWFRIQAAGCEGTWSHPLKFGCSPPPVQDSGSGLRRNLDLLLLSPMWRYRRFRWRLLELAVAGSADDVQVSIGFSPLLAASISRCMCILGLVAPFLLSYNLRLRICGAESRHHIPKYSRHVSVAGFGQSPPCGNASQALASFLVGSTPHPGPQSKFFVLLPLRNNKAVKGNKDKRSN
jgi:hypothetical protein